jgi:hypothetical protein
MTDDAEKTLLQARQTPLATLFAGDLGEALKARLSAHLLDLLPDGEALIQAILFQLATRLLPSECRILTCRARSAILQTCARNRDRLRRSCRRDSVFGRVGRMGRGAMRRRLGEILVGKGTITAQELDLALNIQKKNEGRHRLGEILMERGALNPEALDEALTEQERHRNGEAN